MVEEQEPRLKFFDYADVSFRAVQNSHSHINQFNQA